MKYANIPYEALDNLGKPVMREAHVIGELPHETRQAACAEAAQGIGRLLGFAPVRSVPFGAPVYEAFGLTQPEAKAHPQSALLLTPGHEVPLAHCG